MCQCKIFLFLILKIITIANFENISLLTWQLYTVDLKEAQNALELEELPAVRISDGIGTAQHLAFFPNQKNDCGGTFKVVLSTTNRQLQRNNNNNTLGTTAWQKMELVEYRYDIQFMARA